MRFQGGGGNLADVQRDAHRRVGFARKRRTRSGKSFRRVSFLWGIEDQLFQLRIQDEFCEFLRDWRLQRRRRPHAGLYPQSPTPCSQSGGNGSSNSNTFRWETSKELNIEYHLKLFTTSKFEIIKTYFTIFWSTQNTVLARQFCLLSKQAFQYEQWRTSFHDELHGSKLNVNLTKANISIFRLLLQSSFLFVGAANGAMEVYLQLACCQHRVIGPRTKIEPQCRGLSLLKLNQKYMDGREDLLTDWLPLKSMSNGAKPQVEAPYSFVKWVKNIASTRKLSRKSLTYPEELANYGLVKVQGSKNNRILKWSKEKKLNETKVFRLKTKLIQ